MYKIFNIKTISSFILVIFNFHFSPSFFFHSFIFIRSIFFNLNLFIFVYFLLPLFLSFVISRSSFPHFPLDNFIIHFLILLPFSMPHLLLLHFLLEKKEKDLSSSINSLTIFLDSRKIVNVCISKNKFLKIFSGYLKLWIVAKILCKMVQ